MIAEKPHGLARLADNPVTQAEIRVMVKAAMTSGELPGRRGLPQDDDACVYFGRPNAPFAFATFLNTGHGRVWLDIVYVRQAWRRRGYGSALLAAVEQLARTMGEFDQIMFGTGVDNAAMRAAAQKAGFRLTYVDFTKDIAPAKRESAA